MTDDRKNNPAHPPPNEEDRAFLRWLHHRGPQHFMQLAETMGWAEPRETRESLRYRLKALFGASKARPHSRVGRLEKDRSILGYKAVVDARFLDFEQVVFVQVALRDASRETHTAFTAAINALPQIVACHMITGDFHYMLQIRTQNIAAFQDFLTDEITQIPGVARTATIVAMKTVK